VERKVLSHVVMEASQDVDRVAAYHAAVR